MVYLAPWLSANDTPGSYCIAFLYENDTRPKIFLTTLLYTAGKRGYVIEGLYVEVKQAGFNLDF